MAGELFVTQGDEVIGSLQVDLGYDSPGFDVRWTFETTPAFEPFRPMFDRGWNPFDLRYPDGIRESGLAIKDANRAKYKWISFKIHGPWAYSRGLRPIEPEDPEVLRARVDRAIELIVAEVDPEIVALPKGHRRRVQLEAIVRWLRGSN